MEEIITVSGKPSKKSNCRLIDKEYYLIGDNKIENSGDVYLIDGRYIRMSTGRLVFNHSDKKYQLKNDSLEYGIISMGDLSDFVFGWFNKDFENQILFDKDKRDYICINENIINKNFREEISSGNFYHISLKKASQFNLIKAVKKDYKESLPYDSKGMMKNHIDRYESNYNPKINSTIAKYGKIIEDLTFGFEFETIKGILPDSKLKSLPLIPLRDGSISGLEYVTIPLSGAKGIKALMDCVKELKKRTEYDNDCSLHLHIGNVPRTPEFILAFYKLISHYQDEIFSLFPLYKKYNFGVKRKNYSEPFPFNQINSKLEPCINYSDKEKINQNFDVLFSHLSGGKSFYDYKCNLDNVTSHPLDPNGNQKWNIKKRYYAHNIIPLIFGNKETIEFRIHTPTYDIDKILNFLFINSYLIKYAMINQNKLLYDPYFLDGEKGRSIDRLIRNYSMNYIQLNNNDKEALLNYHLGYIDSRRQATYSQNCSGDIIGKEDDIYCYKAIDWNEELDQKLSFNKYKSSIVDLGNIVDDWMAETELKVSTRRVGINIKDRAPMPSFPKREKGETTLNYHSRVSNWDRIMALKNEIDKEKLYTKGVYNNLNNDLKEPFADNIKIVSADNDINLKYVIKGYDIAVENNENFNEATLDVKPKVKPKFWQ